MGILSSLFGSDDVIKKGADGIYHGVDKAFYTEEEKASYFLDLLKAYEPFKIAQRLLALTVTIPYVLVWLLCSILMIISAFVEPSFSKTLIIAAKDLGAMNNETLGLPVSLVLGFYFGGGAVEGVVTRLRKNSK